MRLLRVVLPLLLLSVPLRAQTAGDPSWSNPISTDRPAVTDSSATVPRGFLQFENGFLETAAQGLDTVDFTETLIRYGIGSTTELRFTVPDYYHSVGSGATLSGFDDFTLGTKQELVNSESFQLAAVLSLTFPTGARGISSGAYLPSLNLPWSAKLSSNWTAAGMLSVYATAQNGSRGALGETTFLFDRQLTRAWDAFLEYAGDFPSQGGPRHLLHAGTSYKLTPSQQLDFHFGVGLSAATEHHIVGIGYSFLFGAKR